MRNKSIFKVRIFCILIFGLVMTCSFYVHGQPSGTSGKVTICDEVVVHNKVNNEGKGSRQIFMLIDEKNFNLDNLNKIFAKYRELYPDPYILVISIYTDKEMLQRLIKFENSSLIVDFGSDEKGKEASRKYYEQYYPLLQGYFRAEYNRYGDFEFFDYSPRKESSDMIRVTLKTQLNRLLKMKPEDAIFEAVKTSDSQSLLRLIEKGVNPNIKDKDGYTPIMWASSEGNAEIIKMLAKAKANLEIRNNSGFGVLDIASQKSMTNSVKVLIELGANVNAVAPHSARDKNNVERYLKIGSGCVFELE